MAKWSWAPLGDAKIAELLNVPMRALENYLGLADKELSRQAIVRTTDATVTTLHTQIVPVNTTVCVTGFVTARRTGGSSGAANDGAGYRVEFVAKNTAGTVALLAAATVTVIGESQAAWAVTVTEPGGSILVRVAGAANNSVSWVWSGKTLSIKE